MVQQIQGRCQNCSGSGYSCPPGDKCGSCNGKCLVPEKKTFEVHIEQGMKQGSKIVLRGEAGCSEPGLAPGDVVLVVVQKEHDTFKRVHSDLILEKKINLADALCGCAVHIKHLDGHIIRVVTPPGKTACARTFMHSSLLYAHEQSKVHAWSVVRSTKMQLSPHLQGVVKEKSTHSQGQFVMLQA